jgi:prolipoprotein diacylglyceryltransferase
LSQAVAIMPAARKWGAMSFERIGPYRLNRADHVAASLAVSFVIGARATRMTIGLIAVVGAAVAFFEARSGDFAVAGGAIGGLLSMFIIAPALRYRKNGSTIYLSYDPEGLVAETDKARTLYKWATLRSYRTIGSRLFIMVSDGCALVIARRFADAGTMQNLIGTIENHRSGE